VIQLDGRDVGDGKPGDGYASIVNALEKDFLNSEFVGAIPGF
jgi:hypothetical protein